VHEAASVRRRQRAGDLRGDLDGLSNVERTALQPLSERLSLDELGDHVGTAVQLAEVVHDQNVRVVEARDGARLLVEAAQAVALRAELRGQELDRDRPIELAVVGEIDLTHAAGTEARHQPISGDFLAAQVEPRPRIVQQHGRRGFEERAHAIARREEQLHLAAQRFVAGARLGHEPCAFASLARERLREHRLDPGPFVRRRHAVFSSL
jgi:hypothetical protein